MSPLRRVLLLAPGALTVYLAFNSGGYFAGAISLVALLLALILLLRVVAAEHVAPHKPGATTEGGEIRHRLPVDRDPYRGTGLHLTEHFSGAVA